MSASEELRKLAAIIEALPMGYSYYGYNGHAEYQEMRDNLFDARHEIIAVVEAAENCPCSDYGTLREQCPQCVALAALAAKLEKQ